MKSGKKRAASPQNKKSPVSSHPGAAPAVAESPRSSEGGSPAAESAEAVAEVRDCRLELGRSGADRVVFRLPELRVGRGERVALTGPSGCGKSTLLNIVSGLVRPDAGSVRVAGQELSRLSVSGLDALRGRRIGFIYQSFNLLDAFTALENVLIGMRFGRAIPRGERHDRAQALLKRVGLSRRLHSKPQSLSAGERQRVAVARAIANEPSLLLADEPTGALDPATAQEVFDLILEVCSEEQRALMLVTHDLSLAERLPRRFDCQGLIVHETAASGAQAIAQKEAAR